MRALLALAACAMLLAGCTGDNSSVSSVPGAFSYGGQVSGKDGMESHVWQNDAQKAYASWGGQVKSGSFTLIVKDSGAREVLHETFHMGNEGRTLATATGAPGAWTVVFIFDDATANMGLTLTSGAGPGGTAPPTGWGGLA
ncbi:MAG: hypothetical protein QOD77_1744 [Thermoplasmata archaeon]|jgi:hypothetical protein|nr:hypothetical protein [Thermoplasmata archaeon]